MQPKTRHHLALALGGLVALAAGPHPARAAERTFERTFAVTASVVLDAETLAGSVTVRPGGAAQVRVRGEVKRRPNWSGAQLSEPELRQLQADPPVRLDGDRVRIERVPNARLWRGAAIDYEIEVPATAEVRVTTESGRVRVEGCGGPVTARTGSAGVDVRDASAPVVVETGSGAVRVGKAGASVKVATGSGSVECSDVGGSLTLETRSGSITASLSGGGDVEVTSGSGSIRVAGAAAALEATSRSGRIDVDGSPGGDWSAESGSGSITIRLPADAAFVLDASSRSGQVSTEHPISAGAVDKHRIAGAVRGGGRTITLRTGSSSIRVDSA